MGIFHDFFFFLPFSYLGTQKWPWKPPWPVLQIPPIRDGSTKSTGLSTKWWGSWRPPPPIDVEVEHMNVYINICTSMYILYIFVFKNVHLILRMCVWSFFFLLGRFCGTWRREMFNVCLLARHGWRVTKIARLPAKIYGRVPLRRCSWMNWNISPTKLPFHCHITISCHHWWYSGISMTCNGDRCGMMGWWDDACEMLVGWIIPKWPYDNSYFQGGELLLSRKKYNSPPWK